MPWLILRLLGIGKWLREALSALVRLAGRFPREAAIIALLLACAWLWHGNTKRDRAIARWEQAAKAWQQASDANRALAVAQVKAVEAKSAQLAKDNQDHEQDLRAQLGARSAAYADRMRADAYCRSTAPAPAEDHPAPVDHGPGADAVILGRTDFDILTENTVRLKAANEWAKSLVKEGMAVPEVGF